MSVTVRNKSKKGRRCFNSLSFTSPYQLVIGIALPTAYIHLLEPTLVQTITLRIIIYNYCGFYIACNCTYWFYVRPFKQNAVVFIKPLRYLSLRINHIQNSIRILFFTGCENYNFKPATNETKKRIKERSFKNMETNIFLFL